MPEIERKFFSQFGEDRILAGLFAGKSSGVCIEVGANDGVHGSNTLYFERLGWQCVLIEPNPSLLGEIHRNRRASIFGCAVSSNSGEITLHVVDGEWQAHAMSTVSDGESEHNRIADMGLVSRPIKVPVCTLDEVLERANIGAPIDFVSIDVEGHEMEVLRGFSLSKWRPEIVIVEDNTGGRDLGPRVFLGSCGYLRFRRTGVNDWYANQDNTRLVNGSARLRLACQSCALAIRSVLRKNRQLVWTYRTVRAFGYGLMRRVGLE